MHDDNINGTPFPRVSSNAAKTIVLECSDLTLLLSDDLTVRDVYCSPPLDRALFVNWIGQKIHSVVSKDSTMKLANVISDNAALPSSERVWRHLNFALSTTKDIPLLVKYFAFNEGDNPLHLICARDLSPVLEMQQRVQSELTRLSREREAIARDPSDHGDV